MLTITSNIKYTIDYYEMIKMMQRNDSFKLRFQSKNEMAKLPDAKREKKIQELIDNFDQSQFEVKPLDQKYS